MGMESTRDTIPVVHRNHGRRGLRKKEGETARKLGDSTATHPQRDLWPSRDCSWVATNAQTEAKTTAMCQAQLWCPYDPNQHGSRCIKTDDTNRASHTGRKKLLNIEPERRQRTRILLSIRTHHVNSRLKPYFHFSDSFGNLFKARKRVRNAST